MESLQRACTSSSGGLEVAAADLPARGVIRVA
jgi:hypothetical protein